MYSTSPARKPQAELRFSMLLLQVQFSAPYPVLSSANHRLCPSMDSLAYVLLSKGLPAFIWKACRRTPKKCDEVPGQSQTTKYLLSTSNSTSHELFHCFRSSSYIFTFVTLSSPLPRAILYHHQLCELRLPSTWNFLKTKKKKKERASHFFIAMSLLIVSITQCACMYYTP